MDSKPVWWMVLFGVVRHLLTIAGTYMLAHGLIDADTHQRLIGEGASQIVGGILIAVPLVWSWLQKRQVWGWVKTALHLSAATPPNTVPAASPGPDMPM